MSVSVQSKTKRSETENCRCSIAYQASSGILIVEYPRDGAYLYHNVPVGVFERLKRSPGVRASFVRGRRHRYSVVTTA
ncbi:KTSC domain-containing protein [candidate division WOR-3 bacterium]|nr:KTSC domain-containing protein [candidate division WOR-3 bacterium]